MGFCRACIVGKMEDPDVVEMMIFIGAETAHRLKSSSVDIIINPKVTFNNFKFRILKKKNAILYFHYPIYRAGSFWHNFHLLNNNLLPWSNALISL